MVQNINTGVKTEYKHIYLNNIHNVYLNNNNGYIHR